MRRRSDTPYTAEPLQALTLYTKQKREKKTKDEKTISRVLVMLVIIGVIGGAKAEITMNGTTYLMCARTVRDLCLLRH